MFMILAIALAAIFITNILIGAFGGTQFLGDVGEVLVLFGASLAFVFLILQREAAAKKKNNVQGT